MQRHFQWKGFCVPSKAESAKLANFLGAPAYFKEDMVGQRMPRLRYYGSNVNAWLAFFRGQKSKDVCKMFALHAFNPQNVCTLALNMPFVDAEMAFLQNAHLHPVSALLSASNALRVLSRRVATGSLEQDDKFRWHMVNLDMRTISDAKGDKHEVAYRPLVSKDGCVTSEELISLHDGLISCAMKKYAKDAASARLDKSGLVLAIPTLELRNLKPAGMPMPTAAFDNKDGAVKMVKVRVFVCWDALSEIDLLMF